MVASEIGITKSFARPTVKAAEITVIFRHFGQKLRHLILFAAPRRLFWWGLSWELSFKVHESTGLVPRGHAIHRVYELANETGGWWWRMLPQRPS